MILRSMIALKVYSYLLDFHVYPCSVHASSPPRPYDITINLTRPYLFFIYYHLAFLFSFLLLFFSLPPPLPSLPPIFPTTLALHPLSSPPFPSIPLPSPPLPSLPLHTTRDSIIFLENPPKSLFQSKMGEPHERWSALNH